MFFKAAVGKVKSSTWFVRVYVCKWQVAPARFFCRFSNLLDSGRASLLVTVLILLNLGIGSTIS